MLSAADDAAKQRALPLLDGFHELLQDPRAFTRASASLQFDARPVPGRLRSKGVHFPLNAARQYALSPCKSRL
jgi:hypothetical protein